MNIKQQYKLAFQKLIVFPGDWHTLKNYQPEIMKVYYHVGLRAQAVSCGFRSSTFKSLEFCGNFKRTHCFFLLQDIISFCNCIFIIYQSWPMASFGAFYLSLSLLILVLVLHSWPVTIATPLLCCRCEGDELMHIH